MNQRSDMPAHAAAGETAAYRDPERLLQDLIHFDTTNPPGNEAECVRYIEQLLAGAGFQAVLLGRQPDRPNLITRLPGRGAAPPLLLHGHVDVVTTANQKWTHPPFEGKVADGYIWGRGTLDMKGGVAMMLAALLRAKAESFVPAGDVVLAILCDEETGSDLGSKYLVENHPEHFRNIRYAISEGGGFAIYIGKRKLYPIMVTEKQLCTMRATVCGAGGHGSMPVRGGAMARLARLIQRLDRRRLPVRITPATRLTVEGASKALPFPANLVLRQTLNPLMTDRILALFGPGRTALDPLFRNTVAATVVHASDKFNVIPSEITIELDGRLLPGCSPEQFTAELRHVIGHDVMLEVIRYDPGPAEPDMGWFDTLAGILRQADAEGTVFPLLFSGVSDARFFRRLGIQTYGFTPIPLPRHLRAWELGHGPDERVPVGAIRFGTDAIYEALKRYGAACPTDPLGSH
ncbi:MAG: M20/M25/M40 family metallo-hydrolase [Dehalococcoidia bacterium]|nr:M20/M25/M40 family metallo-hydrolase [Dehalococcoidia bacterium]